MENLLSQANISASHYTFQLRNLRVSLRTCIPLAAGNVACGRLLNPSPSLIPHPSSSSPSSFLHPPSSFPPSTRLPTRFTLPSSLLHAALFTLHSPLHSPQAGLHSTLVTLPTNATNISLPHRHTVTCIDDQCQTSSSSVSAFLLPPFLFLLAIRIVFLYRSVFAVNYRALPSRPPSLHSMRAQNSGLVCDDNEDMRTTVRREGAPWLLDH